MYPRHIPRYDSKPRQIGGNKKAQLLPAALFDSPVKVSCGLAREPGFL